MRKTTYHERVARAMRASYAAGTFSTYEQILAALTAKFPSEDALRVYVMAIRHSLSDTLGHGVEFPASEMDCQHCSRIVMLNGERGITCDRCGATTRPRP